MDEGRKGAKGAMDKLDLFTQLPSSVISLGLLNATFQLVSFVGWGRGYGTATPFANSLAAYSHRRGASPSMSSRSPEAECSDGRVRQPLCSGLGLGTARRQDDVKRGKAAARGVVLGTGGAGLQPGEYALWLLRCWGSNSRGALLTSLCVSSPQFNTRGAATIMFASRGKTTHLASIFTP